MDRPTPDKTVRATPASGSAAEAEARRDPARARRVGGLLVVGLLAIGAGLLWGFGGPILDAYRWESRRVERMVHGVPCPGLLETPRDPDLADAEVGRLRVWHPETGFQVFESVSDEEGKIRITLWSVDGKIIQQSAMALDFLGRVDNRDAPPWDWGQGDQDAPSIPEELRTPVTGPTTQ